MRLRLPRATFRTRRMALVDGQDPRLGEDSPQQLGQEPGARGCASHLEQRLEAPRRDASPAPLTRHPALPRSGQ